MIRFRQAIPVLQSRGFRNALAERIPALTPTSPQAKLGLELHLVPPKTVVAANGEGAVVDISGSSSRLFVCVLEIADVIEQESLDLSIWGSADGNDWSKKPLLKFPQRFYRGATRMVLDLGDRPEVKSIRARWEVNRWGRGSPVPMFELSVDAREVPRAD